MSSTTSPKMPIVAESKSAVSVPADTKKKETKPRKPTLSAKYSKFLVSNYSLINALKDQGLLNDEGVETAYSTIKLFSSIDEQNEFYESCLIDSKSTAKVMRKFVSDRLKPPKAPRAKREKKPPVNKREEEASGTTKKTKKPRAKKATTVANDTEKDIVSELVAAANAPLETPTPVLEIQVPEVAPSTPDAKPPLDAVPPAPKKAKKTKAKKEETKEKKPKTKKEKKATESKKETPPANTIQADIEEAADEEEEEIHTQEVTINGKTYLMDGDNNVYSVDTHDHIGTYNSEKNVVEEI